MVFFRWMIGLPAAAAITAGLFAFMAGLISMDKGPLPEPVENPDLRITAELGKEPHKNRPIPRPTKLPPTPPEVEIQHQGRSEIPGAIVDFPKTGPIDLGPGTDTGVISPPVIRYAPPYPENCRSKGVEGQVLVQFDVTPEGNVINVIVIESPDRCFNRTVIRAVSRWKYPPAYQGERPVTRYGVVEAFSFRLSG